MKIDLQERYKRGLKFIDDTRFLILSMKSEDWLSHDKCDAMFGEFRKLHRALRKNSITPTIEDIREAISVIKFSDIDSRFQIFSDYSNLYNFCMLFQFDEAGMSAIIKAETGENASDWIHKAIRDSGLVLTPASSSVQMDVPMNAPDKKNTKLI